MALQGAHELHGIAALGEHAIERAVEGHKLAVEGGGDDVVDADRRGVAQHGQRIVERDRLAAVALLVEQELVDLAAALAAIAAQPLDDPFQRIGIDGEPLRPGGAFDQAFEGGLVVHVAGQRRQAGLGLGERAQARARREVAAFDHDQRVAGRRLDQVLQRRRRLLACRPHADHAPAAHQRHGAELVGQPRRVALQGIAADVDHAERILEVLAHGLGERQRAFGDQPVVIAVDDDAADLGIRLLQEGVDLTRLDLHTNVLATSGSGLLRVASRISLARRPGILQLGAFARLLLGLGFLGDLDGLEPIALAAFEFVVWFSSH